MKKIIALILCFAFALCLCSCKGEKTEESLVDLEYYASLGQMPETEFALGSSADEVLEFLEQESQRAEENGEHTVTDVIEGETQVLITDGSFEYYYKKVDSDKKIGCIVSLGDSFTFKTGTIILEVKNALKGIELEEVAATEENAFFYMGDLSTATVLIAEFEKNTAVLVFEENALSTAAIYRNDWK